VLGLDVVNETETGIVVNGTETGSVQGQVGWSSEPPGLVEGVPAHGRGIGTR